jgi:hypothetical protein
MIERSISRLPSKLEAVLSHPAQIELGAACSVFAAWCTPLNGQHSMSANADAAASWDHGITISIHGISIRGITIHGITISSVSLDDCRRLPERMRPTSDGGCGSRWMHMSILPLHAS